MVRFRTNKQAKEEHKENRKLKRRNSKDVWEDQSIGRGYEDTKHKREAQYNRIKEQYDVMKAKEKFHKDTYESLKEEIEKSRQSEPKIPSKKKKEKKVKPKIINKKKKK